MVLASGDNPCLNWLSLCYYSLKNTSLLSGKKFSNLTLYFFFSRLGISHVSKDSWFLLIGNIVYKPMSRSSVQFSSIQFSRSVVSNSATPWIAACQASLSITNSRSLLKPMPIESVMPSSHLILCRPLLLLPPVPPSIRVFSNESTLHISWPQYWSFSFSISPSSEHPGLISFGMDWLDLLAVQGNLKSLQHHNSEASEASWGI